MAEQTHRFAWWLVPLVVIAVAAIALLVLAGMPYGDHGQDRRPAAPTETIADGAPTPSQAPVETGTIVEAGEEPKPAAPRPAARPAPAAQPARGSGGEISESEALATLRGYINGRDYYHVEPDCIAVRSGGYRNVGYTIDVRDSCSSRLLGRWRVDAKTREVFRQREDGRYLRP